jgi:hypothetical protein
MLLGLVPSEIRKSASDAEMARRLNEYQRLNAQAHDMTLSGPLRQEAFARAWDTLHAPVAPRAVPQRQASPVRKAKLKAGDEAPVAVFDQRGNLVGVADPGDIIEVAGSAAKPKPQAPASPAQAAQAMTDAGNTGDALDEDSEVAKALLRSGAARVFKSSGQPVIATRIQAVGQSRREKASSVIARSGTNPASVRKAVSQDRRVRVCNRHGRTVGTTMQSAICPVPRDTASAVAKASLSGFVNVYNSSGKRVGIVERDAVRVVGTGR